MEFETQKILAVNICKNVRRMRFDFKQISDSIQYFQKKLEEQRIPWPQIFEWSLESGVATAWVTSPMESLKSIEEMARLDQMFSIDKQVYEIVSATGFDQSSTDLPFAMSQTLKLKGIEPIGCLFSSQTISFIVQDSQSTEAAKTLHEWVQ